MMDTDLARRNMIRQQVRCWDVSSPRVLETLASVPRERFVAERYENLAFADAMLPIDEPPSGSPRRMLSPKLEGRILQALDIRPFEQALVIGIGSGYLAACVARLARHVTGIDVSAELVAAAGRRLADLGVTNVDLMARPEFCPPAGGEFDVIAITGSLPAYDERIESWLRPGGRAFVVVGAAPAMEAWLIERPAEDEVAYRSLFETCVAPLANARAPDAFEFSA